MWEGSSAKMSRRNAILALICFIANTVGVRSQTTCSMTNPCKDQLGQGQDFVEPQQLCRDDNSNTCTVTLNVDIGTITFDWLTLYRRMYNDQVPGQSITVRRGGLLVANVVNHLSPVGNDNGNEVNELRFPNSTNLHTHGLHVSSVPPGDDVLTPIDPEGTFQYRYDIHSRNSPGTYWYHAHVHGSTALQVNGGMGGLLIIEDDPDDMPWQLDDASCPNNCDHDVHIVFQPLLRFGGFGGYESLQNEIGDYEGFKNDQYNVTGGGTLTEWLAANINNVTVNGLVRPRLSLDTGDMYRFRMVNAAGRPFLEMYITEDGVNVPTSKCQIREIATDGVYLNAPREMHGGQSLVLPGGRVDWLVKCTQPGTYQLSSYHKPVNDYSMGVGATYNDDMITLVVTGDAWEGEDFPDTLPDNQHDDLQNIPEDQITGRFVFEFGPEIITNRQKWPEPISYRYKMTIDQIQEWIVLNSATGLSHPIHIHINHFQVISYNNYTGGYGMTNDNTWYLNNIMDVDKNCYYQHPGYTPDNDSHPPPPGTFDYLGHNYRYAADNGTIGYARVGDWKETMLVPPLANITIRFNPEDFACVVVIHCHILQHEDEGMMMVVEIVDAGESTDADIKTGNAYPGTCPQCDRYPPNNATNLCGETDGGSVAAPAPPPPMNTYYGGRGHYGRGRHGRGRGRHGRGHHGRGRGRFGRGRYGK